MTKKIENKAYIYCLIAMFGWGSMFIAAKLAFTAISGLTLLFFRYLIAFCVLLFVYRKMPHPQLTITDKKNLLFIGIFGYCFSIALQLVGTSMVDASVASIINTMTPVVIIVFAVILLKERITLKQVIGILVTVVGSMVIVGGIEEGNSLLGVGLNFAGMIFWGLSSVMIRKSCGEMDSRWVSLYGMGIAMVSAIPLIVFERIAGGSPLIDMNWAAMLAVVWIGVVPTAVSNLFWSKALELLPAATCSLFYALLPVVTAVLGILILGEALTEAFVLGGAIIIAGMIVAVIGGKKTMENKESDISI